MPVLRIQHSVPSFEAWKRAFDNDPVDRKGRGVRRYQVLRSVTDPNLVMIDLEFDALDRAEAFQQKLLELWKGPARSVMQNPESWIVESMESKEL